jgi:hypothetical protein
MMDLTYKTSQYKISLFEIVGFTSTEMICNVGFAFIPSEKEENFTWDLQECDNKLKCKIFFEGNC